MRRARPPRWIPLLALAPLLALVAADAVMATLAARSDPGLVADAPRRLGFARLAPTAGLKLDAAFERIPAGHRLTIRLRDAAGAPVPAEAAEARLERTTHAGADRAVPLRPAPDGSWRGDILPPDGGAWQVTLAARDAEGRSALSVLRLP